MIEVICVSQSPHALSFFQRIPSSNQVDAFNIGAQYQIYSRHFPKKFHVRTKGVFRDERFTHEFFRVCGGGGRLTGSFTLLHVFARKMLKTFKGYLILIHPNLSKTPKVKEVLGFCWLTAFL